jgi:flagellar protein FliS
VQSEPANPYLRSAVLTATPEQLQLMLYDGAIRFATQAREAMHGKRLDESCELLLRAQRIVLELQNGLRREVNPTLCDQLEALHQFVYRRLIDANTVRDEDAIDDALRILRHQRETWALLLDRLRQPARDGRGEGSPVEPEQSVSVRC